MSNLQQVDWSKIPSPQDDGGANHLAGMSLPAVALQATSGETVDLSTLPGRSVVYVYPMTSSPDVPLPDNWNMTPGARGCTPQSCAFRDHYAELTALGVAHLYGLSVQDTAYQLEAVERLHLPYALLSDQQMQFADALRLPRFEVAGMTLLKRVTLIASDGVIDHVIYPVFPPDRNAEVVIEWLTEHH